MAVERTCGFCLRVFMGRKDGRWCTPECRRKGVLAENKIRLADDSAFREKNRLRSEQFRLSNPEQVKLRKSAWYERNAERLKPVRQKYYRENRERLQIAKDAWIAANRETVRSIKSRYKYARRLNMDKSGVLDVSGRDLKRQVSRQNNLCSYCSEPFTELRPVTWDHVIPVSRGGKHSIGNLVACCQPCNSSKNNKTITEWRKWQRLTA